MIFFPFQVVGQSNLFSFEDEADSEDDSTSSRRDNPLHQAYKNKIYEDNPWSRSITPIINDLAPSPVPIRKHDRSESPHDNIDIKIPKINEKSRPKAANFNDIVQEVIGVANAYYRCFLSAKDAFPDTQTELNFVCNAWARAIDDTGSPASVLTPSISRVV